MNTSIFKTLKFNRPRSPLLPCAAGLKEEDGDAPSKASRARITVTGTFQRTVKIPITEN